MSKVPYYHRTLDGSYFQKRGWRGRLILVLNWFRALLQRWAEYHVMLFIADRNGLGKEVKSALKLRWTEEHKENARHRKTTLAALALGEGETSEQRYKQGRKNSSPDEQQGRFSRLLAGKGAKRYTRSRAGTNLDVQEVDFEMVPESELVRATNHEPQE